MTTFDHLQGRTTDAWPMAYEALGDLVYLISVRIIGLGLRRVVDGDRRPLLQTITAPALVIHGRDDPLVPLPGGQDTADHISAAKRRVVGGMGRDLSPVLLPQAILQHCNTISASSPYNHSI